MRKYFMAAVALSVLMSIALFAGCKSDSKEDEAVTSTPEGQNTMKQNMMKGQEMMKQGKGQ